MMVTTLPWHWLGLSGQWRRVAHFDYADPVIAWWGPWVTISFIGGLILLASALIFLLNLASFHQPAAANAPEFVPSPERYALSLHPVGRVPAVLNGFTTWNLVLLLLMLLAYGWPVARFVVAPSPGAVAHRMFEQAVR